MGFRQVMKILSELAMTQTLFEKFNCLSSIFTQCVMPYLSIANQLLCFPVQFPR